MLLDQLVSEGPYKVQASCDQCGKTFKSKMKLKMHASQMHSDIMFACIICQKEFKGKRNLARQMPSCDRGVSSSSAREDAYFNCEICRKSFK